MKHAPKSSGSPPAAAVLLTAGMTTWWWISPPEVLLGGDAQGPRRFVAYALIALPIALIAAGAVAWRAHRRPAGPYPLAARAAATAGLFAALLLVTAPLHGTHRSPPPAEPNLAAVRYDMSCPAMLTAAECRQVQAAFAGTDARNIAQAHHAMMAKTGHTAADHAAMNQPFYTASSRDGANAVSYAVQDAAIAFVAATPLALLALLLARRLPVPRPPRRRTGRIRARLLPSAAAVGLVVTGTVVVNSPATAAVTPFTTALRIPPVLTGSELTIDMRQADVQIMPDGPATRMWTYNGSFPGPIIRRPSGQTTRVTFQNHLPSAAGQATIHHHGSHARPSEDGQPDSYLIPAGARRTYVYENREDGAPERSVTQWYHDHRMDVTGRNVWNGLVGMFILDDAVDAALPLPRGQYDVPLIINDRTFDANNQIPYTFSIIGTLGDTWLVNGRPQPYLTVADHRYRFRILNSANRRPLVLALSNGAAMTQIGTDSGLLPAPVQRTSIVLQPAERVEIVVDFNGLLGQNLVLLDTNTPATPGNPPHELMQFRVSRDVSTDTSSVPAALRPEPTFPPPDRDRTFVLRASADSTGAPTMWTINNQAFDPDRIDADPVLGSTERWSFFNVSPQPHAIHLHDVDWRLTNRFQVATGPDGEPTAGNQLPVPAYEAGLKETFFVPANQGISVVTRFTDNAGEYMFHCHMLEHEDMAMMGRFVVRPPA